MAVETPAEATSADVQAGEGSEASIPGKTPDKSGEAENLENGHRPRRDKAVERLFKMQTRFMGEQNATNKLLLESIQKLTGGMAASADKKPELKDFEKPEEFATAIEAWVGRETVRKAAEPKPAKKPDESRQPGGEQVELSDEQRVQVLSQKFGLDEEVAEQFVEAQADASERIPDFEEVVSDPKIPSSRVLSRLIIELGDADLQYHLSKRENRLKTLELSKLKRSGDVLDKLKEIQGELAEAGGEEKPTERKPAPDSPINPVGSSRAPSKKSPAKQSADEYFANRQAEVNKNKRLF